MPEPRRILYRGIPMIEGWPKKIVSAQNVLSYTLNGEAVLRIRYGDEHDDWHADQNACHDCRVIKGELHVPSCDVEECPACGGQLLSCDCPFDERSDRA
jgi:rRNA maturation endonuclease Nob1